MGRPRRMEVAPAAIRLCQVTSRGSTDADSDGEHEVRGAGGIDQRVAHLVRAVVDVTHRLEAASEPRAAHAQRLLEARSRCVGQPLANDRGDAQGQQRPDAEDPGVTLM